MGKALRILLIEDNPDHAHLIQRQLTSLDYPVKIYHFYTDQYQEDLVFHTRPQLILMDYFLSPYTGLDLLKNIKKSFPEIPVVVITGQGDEKTAAESIHAGAEDYIVKTRSNLENLPQLLKRILEKRKNIKNKSPEQTPKDEKLLSVLFQEVEQISTSLQRIYSKLSSKTPFFPFASEIQRLPQLQIKMNSLKHTLNKIFRKDLKG